MVLCKTCSPVVGEMAVALASQEVVETHGQFVLPGSCAAARRDTPAMATRRSMVHRPASRTPVELANPARQALLCAMWAYTLDPPRESHARAVRRCAHKCMRATRPRDARGSLLYTHSRICKIALRSGARLSTGAGAGAVLRPGFAGCLRVGWALCVPRGATDCISDHSGAWRIGADASPCRSPCAAGAVVCSAFSVHF